MGGGIIVLEGPDCGGKSTLMKHMLDLPHRAARLCAHLRVHADVRKWHTAALRRARRIADDGRVAVIDRHWPSEEIYGRVMRGSWQEGYDAMEMDAALREMNAIYVFCLPALHGGGPGQATETWARLRQMGGRQEYVDRVDKMRDVETMYWDLFRGSRAPIVREQFGGGWCGALCSVGGMISRSDVFRYNYLRDDASYWARAYVSTAAVQYTASTDARRTTRAVDMQRRMN